MGSEALHQEVGRVGKSSILREVGRRRLRLWISLMLDLRWGGLDMLIILEAFIGEALDMSWVG